VQCQARGPSPEPPGLVYPLAGVSEQNVNKACRMRYPAWTNPVNVAVCSHLVRLVLTPRPLWASGSCNLKLSCQPLTGADHRIGGCTGGWESELHAELRRRGFSGTSVDPG
jgi:hypothetical protein